MANALAPDGKLNRLVMLVRGGPINSWTPEVTSNIRLLPGILR